MDARSSPSREFEELVRRILESVGFKVEAQPPSNDRGFDFVGSLGDEKWAIAVKYYRTDRAQPQLIEAAAARIANQSSSTRDLGGMLIVSSILPPGMRNALTKEFSITLFDRTDLETLTSEKPLLSEKLQALLGSNLNQFLEDDREKPSDLLKRQKSIQPKSVADEDTRGTTLCTLIRDVEPGKEWWPQYEALCTDSLTYLFPNDLHGWHKQKRTDDGLNRFDFVCRLRPTTEFWKFLMDHLNSRYVIFEFKNYGGKISQGQILTTEKYLLERGLRRVAIILSRKGADRQAVEMTQGAMREHGKLMLVLDDDNLCEMLHRKEKGEDPSDLLFEWADEFLLKLPR
jgi:hypothetical protein